MILKLYNFKDPISFSLLHITPFDKIIWNPNLSKGLLGMIQSNIVVHNTVSVLYGDICEIIIKTK